MSKGKTSRRGRPRMTVAQKRAARIQREEKRKQQTAKATGQQDKEKQLLNNPPNKTGNVNQTPSTTEKMVVEHYSDDPTNVTPPSKTTIHVNQTPSTTEKMVVEHYNDDPTNVTPPSKTIIAKENENISNNEELLYSSAAQSTSKTLPSSTFLLHKHLQEEDFHYFNDDETVNTNQQYESTRMSMMVTIPKKEEDDDKSTAPLQAISEINNMLKSLFNKMENIKIGPWNATPATIVKKDLITKFTEDDVKSIDIAEQYLYNFNRFIRSGSKCYIRVQLFHPFTVTSAHISDITSQFAIPKIQNFKLAQSKATSPLSIGTLTGSVSAMAGSKNFYELFKVKFNLKHLGLWWTQARSSNGGEWNRSKSVLNIEIDKCDQFKTIEIENYFNSYSKAPADNFLGTPMTFVPAYNNLLDDDTKDRISKNVRSQGHLGKSIKCITITGIALNNWINKKEKKTLLEELMSLESIYEKKVAGKKDKTFKGRLFYAIIPTSATKTATFYYSAANQSEGRSVARGLPCFIKEYYKKDPSFYCTSDLIYSALNGEWSLKKRTFMTQDEVEEHKRNENLENEMCAEVFISKDHQRALATKDDDTISVDKTITGKDNEPPPANDDVSDITGETRESKVKTALAKLSVQHHRDIQERESKLQEQESKLQDQADRIKRLEDLLSRSFGVDDAVVTPTSKSLQESPNDPKKRLDDTLAEVNKNTGTNSTKKLKEHFKKNRREYDALYRDQHLLAREEIEIEDSDSTLSEVMSTGSTRKENKNNIPSPNRKGVLAANVNHSATNGATADRKNKAKVSILNDGSMANRTGEEEKDHQSDGSVSTTSGDLSL